MTTKLIPAILAKDKLEFKKQWTRIALLSSFIQIDITDGIFVKTKTNIKPREIKAITKNHKLELHLMVKSIDDYLIDWLKLNNIKRVIWHYEAMPETSMILCLNDFLQHKKIKTGLSINPETSLQKIIPLLPAFDAVQIMGVNPGQQGQALQTKVIAKIKKIRQRYPQLDIEIDGGVNQKNFSKLKKAGANQFILGSYLQKASDPKQAWQELK